MNVEIKINTKQKVNVGKLESALKDMPKDELREVSKALEDLNGTIQKVICTPVFKKGDYVRSQSDPSIYGVIISIAVGYTFALISRSPLF